MRTEPRWAIVSLIAITIVSGILALLREPPEPWRFSLILTDESGHPPLEIYSADKFSLSYLAPKGSTATGYSRYSIEVAEPAQFSVIATPEPNVFLVSIDSDLRAAGTEFTVYYPVGNGSVEVASGDPQDQYMIVEE